MAARNGGCQGAMIPAGSLAYIIQGLPPDLAPVGIVKQSPSPSMRTCKPQTKPMSRQQQMRPKPRNFRGLGGDVKAARLVSTGGAPGLSVRRFGSPRPAQPQPRTTVDEASPTARPDYMGIWPGFPRHSPTIIVAQSTQHC